MQIISIKDIRNHSPCYDPSRYLDENWNGTLLDILDDGRIPSEDRIWVFSRLATERQCRLFAVYCMDRCSSDITDIREFQMLVMIMLESVDHRSDVEGLKDDFYTTAYNAACWAAYNAAYGAACWAAYNAAHSTADSVAERIIQIDIAKYCLEEDVCR